MKHLTSRYKVFTNHTVLISVGVGFACLFLVSAFLGIGYNKSSSQPNAGNASQMPTMFAKAQAQFLATDDAFNTALSAQIHSHSMQHFNLVHAQIDFDRHLRILHREIEDLRVHADDVSERKTLHQLDGDLRIYESLTGSTISAGSDSTTLAVNAVNEDFDALENRAATIVKSEHDQIFSSAIQGRVTLVAFALCTLLLTALTVLQLRRTSPQSNHRETMGPLLPKHLLMTPVDIIAEQSAIVAAQQPASIIEQSPSIAEPIAEVPIVIEPIDQEPVPIEAIAEEPIAVEPIADEAIAMQPLADEPEKEQVAEIVPEPIAVAEASMETQATNNTLEADTSMIEHLTEKSQQLVAQLSALNKVADSTMMLANSVVNEIEKSPERTDLDHVTNNLHALAHAMLMTVQQLSGNTATMQNQVAQIIESLDRIV